MKSAIKILLICDSKEISDYLKEYVTAEGDCAVLIKREISEGLEALKQENFDVIIIRFEKLDSESKAKIGDFKKIDADCIIIALVEEAIPDDFRDPSQSGIYDFIIRPISLEKIIFLIQKGAQLHSIMSASRKLTQGLKEQNTALEKQNSFLAKRVEDSTKNLTRLYEDLRSTYMRTIKVLAQAIDARDHYTHSHSEHVATIAVAIAQELGLSVKDTELIRQACELHDLGKIGVEDCVLGKTSSLSEEEWKQIKQHPITGAKILEPLTFLNGVIELIKQHHEHYDGAGYPEGRKGEDILFGARIIHLADAYESMCSARSYRKTPLTKEEAVAEIKKNSGTQFDPKIVEAFLKIVDKL